MCLDTAEDIRNATSTDYYYFHLSRTREDAKPPYYNILTLKKVLYCVREAKKTGAAARAVPVVMGVVLLIT